MPTGQESRVRSKAARLGYSMTKARTCEPGDNQGEFTLTDEHNYVVLSDSFYATLHEIEKYLDERPRPLTPAEVPKPRFADD